MALLTATGMNITDAFEDLPATTTVSRLAFPSVNMRSRKGHAQGIALRRGPAYGHPSVDTLYVSFSEFPKGWGSLFVCNDQGLFNATYLPSARHPGGLAVSGNTLVIAFENGEENPWVAYYDISLPLHPRELARCSLKPPQGRPNQNPRDVGDQRKASAVGAVHRGDELWVAVMSQDRYVRILRSHPGAEPVQLASFNASDLDSWPKGRVEGISLLIDDEDQIWLTAQSARGRWVKGNLGRGADWLTLYRLTVDGWPQEEQDRTAGDYLTPEAEKEIDLGHQKTRSGLDRASFRWGSSVMVLDGTLSLMATERGKSGRFFRRGKLDVLDFAHSPVFEWDEGHRA